ncbi:unnamed protein product [Urochloa decumbens]|uniref:BSD2 cysteine rich domain-containing protein n=1 Tax=Urochloa decumbens TaxID=240449 RepID=A0ABC9E4Z0_9POAL
MAATTSLAATAPSAPALLKASPAALISLRPVSLRGKSLSVKTKATENDQSAKKPQKVNSILCQDCEGNELYGIAQVHENSAVKTSAIVCTQCEGSGVNSADHFNGRFKAGALCWLCRGKREILCGSCNGAGFLGGFMSTCDETGE